jgi:hypothetical protein
VDTHEHLARRTFGNGVILHQLQNLWPAGAVYHDCLHFLVFHYCFGACLLEAAGWAQACRELHCDSTWEIDNIFRYSNITAIPQRRFEKEVTSWYAKPWKLPMDTNRPAVVVCDVLCAEQQQKQQPLTCHVQLCRGSQKICSANVTLAKAATQSMQSAVHVNSR